MGRLSHFAALREAGQSQDEEVELVRPPLGILLKLLS